MLNSKTNNNKGFIVFIIFLITTFLILTLNLGLAFIQSGNWQNSFQIQNQEITKIGKKTRKPRILINNLKNNQNQGTQTKPANVFDNLLYEMLEDWGEAQRIEALSREYSKVQQQQNKKAVTNTQLESILYEQNSQNEEVKYKNWLQSSQQKIQNSLLNNVQNLKINKGINDNQILSIPKISHFQSKDYSLQSFGATPPPNLQYNQIDHQQQIKYEIKSNVSQQQIRMAVEYLQLKNQPLACPLAQQQKQYYQNKYNISQYAELPFCIVVPSYNNAEGQRYLKNIESIMQQDYSNFHVVFIDDSSTDGTAQLIQKYVYQKGISNQKIKIVKNKGRSMALPNIYRASKQFCKSYQIFMIVDGDDELIGKQVFNHFNSIFQKQNVWLVYSNFISSTSHTLGYSRPYLQVIVEQNSYRKAAFTISHLRAFYTKLLHLVKQKDLKDQQGNWFRAANDVAIYIPILQMVHKKLKYTNQISYLYNFNTGLNNHLTKGQQQKQNQKKIKSKKPYYQIQQLFDQEEKELLKNNTHKKIW